MTDRLVVFDAGRKWETFHSELEFTDDWSLAFRSRSFFTMWNDAILR